DLVLRLGGALDLLRAAVPLVGHLGLALPAALADLEGLADPCGGLLLDLGLLGVVRRDRDRLARLGGLGVARAGRGDGHGDLLARVGLGELVGRLRGLLDRLAVALPLVGDLGWRGLERALGGLELL